MKKHQHRPAKEPVGRNASEQRVLSAYSIKELHTRLGDLTNDELKNVSIVPTGTHLEEGAQYIDLTHLERGAFFADASMVAPSDHYYVAKKETDYVLWNRLNQVENPARLDEPGS